MKRGWVPVCDEYDTCYMQKGEAWFPVHWSRNSLATHMRISRLEEMVVQGNGEDADQRLGEASAADQRLGTASAEGNQRLGDASVEGGTQTESFLASEAVRMVVVIDEEMAEHAESPGWSLSTSMLPVHFAYNMSTTVDPSARFNPDEWPHRSTLIWKGGREYEVFECGEYWEPNRTLDLDVPARKLLTILTKDPIEPSQLEDVRSDDRAWVPGANPLRERADGSAEREEGARSYAWSLCCGSRWP